METFLTKTMTIVALLCFLVVGAAVTAIVGRDSIPAARFELASASTVQAPVSNKESKKDRLAVISYATAALEPQPMDAALSESLRRAYASTSPADLGMPKEIAAPAAPSTTQALAPITVPAPAKPKAAEPKTSEAKTSEPKTTEPKAAAKPQPQKSYALLSDVQIAGIKERLKLSASQESYWPPVETALRA